MTDSGLPVVAGLAVGIGFMVLFAIILRPDLTLSDQELIAKYSKLAEIHYFLEKHPDAKAEVGRYPYEQALSVSYSVEKQVDPVSGLYTGINVLTITADKNELNHLTLSIDCTVSRGVTVQSNFDDVSAIGTAEEWCFQTQGKDIGLFEPDTSGDELNDEVYQFSFKP